MAEVETTADRVLREGLDDWVPLDLILWYARDESRDTSKSFEEYAVRLLRYLLSEGLMTIGELGASGFEAWQESPDEAVKRVVSACDEVDWEPLGGLFWLSNTTKGNQRVQGEA